MAGRKPASSRSELVAHSKNTTTDAPVRSVRLSLSGLHRQQRTDGSCMESGHLVSAYSTMKKGSRYVLGSLARVSEDDEAVCLAAIGSTRASEVRTDLRAEPRQHYHLQHVPDERIASSLKKLRIIELTKGHESRSGGLTALSCPRPCTMLVQVHCSPSHGSFRA